MVNTTFVARPVRQTSQVRMRGKMTAKDTSSPKLIWNLVLYKNLTDLCRVFLPNRRQRLIIMALHTSVIRYISISLSMVIFIMKYEITDKGPKLLTKIINITENSRKG